jgi:hypothetical protein
MKLVIADGSIGLLATMTSVIASLLYCASADDPLTTLRIG